MPQPPKPATESELKQLWSPQICHLVDTAFNTVPASPSHHDEAVAYRRAIAAAYKAGQQHPTTTGHTTKLLKEAVTIIHCHLRNTHKDFLTRARQHIGQLTKDLVYPKSPL